MARESVESRRKMDKSRLFAGNMVEYFYNKKLGEVIWNHI